MTFNPADFGATPVGNTPQATGNASFNASQFGASPVQSTAPMPAPSLGDSVWNGLMGIGNAVAGGASDVIGSNLANIANSAPGLAEAPAALLGNKGAQQDIARRAGVAKQLPQTSLEQNVGAGVQLGATSAGLAAAPETVGGAAAAGTLLGGAQGAGSSMAANESPTEVLSKGATGAAVGGATGATIAGTGKLLGQLGDKIMTTAIKPTKSDLQDGFSIKTIKDFNLGGSLNQTYNKTQATLNDLTSQLHEKLASSNATVNMQDIYQKTAADLTKQGSSFKTFGFNGKISGALRQLQDEVLSVGGNIPIPEAQLVKQSAGKLGAWTFGKPDPESSATEAVYSAFYRNLKTAIEQNSPPGVKEINSQIGKLIPVQNALIRRMPVAERNSALSLTDIISMSAGTVHPSAFGLSLINRFTKSGIAGNVLSKYVAGALQGISPVAGEIAGGGASTIASQSSEPGAMPTGTGQ